MEFIFKEAKGKKITIRFKLFILIIIIILIYIFHENILVSVGNFLTVQEYHTNSADVILLEEESLLKSSIEKCNSLYYEKNCKEVWIIRLPFKQDLIPEEKFGDILKEVLDSCGYRFNFRLFYFYLEHPYTLNKTNIVADSLKKYGYKKVLVLTNAFHSKRTYNVYKKILIPEGFHVFCSTYYPDYNSFNWWKSSNGFRGVISEYLKLIYYWIKGYM